VHAYDIPRALIDSTTVASLAAIVFLPLAIGWALFNQPATFTFLERFSASPVSAAYLSICTVICIAAAIQRLARWRHDRGCKSLLSDRAARVRLPAGAASYAASGRFNLMARAPLNQVFDVRIHEKELAIPRLAAAYDGLRILHVTDLHFCGRIKREFFEHLIEATNASAPDIVALTGDLVEGDPFIDWFPATLGRLRGRLGTYYVLGNHDRRATTVRLHGAMADLGFTHVAGKCHHVSVKGAPIIIGGNELPWYTPATDFSQCPSVREPASPLRLLLAHSPDQFQWAHENDVDLMLAGHLHGGQIRLPLVGAITSPSVQGVRYVCGVFREGNTVMHVSRGVGSMTPIRLNCPPEIALLTLRMGAAS
jgi:predicted MPP superfamily phosphohydrolase